MEDLKKLSHSQRTHQERCHSQTKQHFLKSGKQSNERAQIKATHTDDLRVK